MFNNTISPSLNTINLNDHSMVPQLYGIKAVNDRVTVDNLGVQVIQTRIPAVLILFGFMVQALNVTLTKQKGNYGDDCTDFWHSGAVLSDQISKGVAKINVELSEPGEYYLCFQRQQSNLDDKNKTKVIKQWLHQGSDYHVTLRVVDRLMPIPLQISLIILGLALSGTFSGLNLGLMSLDLNEIQVIIRCGTELEKQYAKIIAPIRKKGNYLLCSILFGNVLVNSTLTILMDDLTSGLVAVIISTLSIVIFGEIVPQAICSRHGLAVGAKTIYLTKLFMLLTFPLSLFISKILDKVLGEEIGHCYDRERLMEYIRITKTYNQLEDDEMNIISGALCLKTKTAEDVMTRIEDAFMLPITAILDFNTLSEIAKKGYSRIPVYDSERKNIIALLHSKDLTFVDPDDKKPLKTIVEFFKHPLIYTESDEKLNNVFNCFKSGKSHMAFVRKLVKHVDEDPYYEIIGLVTLEDVIEEILQIEIVDETDILTDNRRKMKRKETQSRQDFSDFAKISENELGTQNISPQMALATFQYLSTTIEPFQRKYITENILKRLIAQKIYYLVEIGDFEDRTYLTVSSTNSFNAAYDDESKLLYKYGKPADYFIMILEGKVKVIVGNEKLTYESGPFTYFGVSALKPPVLATKMLLGGNNSNFNVNNLNNLNSNLIQTKTADEIPLLENESSLQTTNFTRPNTPDTLIRSPSNHSELCAKTGYISNHHQHVGHLETTGIGHSFIPDFTVKPITKTLYMKIPRKVYLAAFRASLFDRKDEFLERDLEMFNDEEIDAMFYKKLANSNKTISNNKIRKASNEIIKDKKFILPKFMSQQQETTTNPTTTAQIKAEPALLPIISSQTQIAVTNVITNVVTKQQHHQQRRSSLINFGKHAHCVQSSNKIEKFVKQHSMPGSNLSVTNLANLNANNNSYTTVNNNLSSTPISNLITNPQLEKVVVIDGGCKDKKNTKF